MSNLTTRELTKEVTNINKPFWDQTITAAVTSVTSATLDGMADGGYDFEIWIYNPTGSTSAFSMYVNNDQTAANYDRTSMYTAGVSAGVANSADALIANVLTTGRAIVTGTLNISPDGYVSYNFIEKRLSDKYILVHGVTKNATVTNVTRIDVVGSVASSIGINSRIRFWRRR